MNNRGVLVLLAAVVVLAGLALFGQRGSNPSAQNSELVPGLQAQLNDIERMTVTKAGGVPVATLERHPDSWVVVEKAGYRADVAKIRKNLVALAEAKVLEQKTANPELYARLGVEDIAGDGATGLAISLAASNRELPTLILGKAEGTKYRYARRADEAQSFLIDRDPDLPRTAAQWVDPSILNVRGDRVQQVTITHPDGDVVAISKADPAAMNYTIANIPAGRQLLYPGVANIIGNALRELNLEDVEPLAAGATEAASDQPQVVAEFRTFDGLVVTARAVKQGADDWVTFDAAFSAEQAAQFASVAAAGDDADKPAAAPAEGDAPSAAKPAPDAAAEAQRINQRVGGWRYRLAGYQYDQMTRGMKDLLKPAA